MFDFTTEIILAVGGAALLAALAFRQLVDTVVKLNRELKDTIRERHIAEVERDALQDTVEQLEDQLKDCRDQLGKQVVRNSIQGEK